MTCILEKYLDLYPPILFLCSNDVNSMHFILSIKYLSDAQQEELVELMRHCGAEVSFNVEDATDHSAVIVDHDEVVNVTAPTFTINYLEECLSKLKVQDISDYRQGATSHIASGVQCMDVVYFRRRCWGSVLTETEKQWFDGKVDSSRAAELSKAQSASCCADDISSVVNKLGSCEHEDDSEPEEENSKTVAGSRFLSSDEDSYLEQTDNRVCVNKTHEKAENITIEIENCRNPKAAKERTNSLAGGSKALDSKSKNGAAVHSGKNQNISSESREIDTTSSFSGPSSSERNFFGFNAGNEDLFNPSKDKKRSRKPYSYDEQSKILKYIVYHSEYSRIKGRQLWMIMEMRKVCPTRTWQSMKEHFLKKIAFKLEDFHFLTKSNKMKLKQFVF